MIACSDLPMFENFWPVCEQCCGAGLVAQHRVSATNHSVSISRSARYIAMVLHRPFLRANSHLRTVFLKDPARSCRVGNSKTGYRDAYGNVWTGLGEMLEWLCRTVAAAQSIDHFRCG